jgi:hypothetical protein
MVRQRTFPISSTRGFSARFMGSSRLQPVVAQFEFGMIQWPSFRAQPFFRRSEESPAWTGCILWEIPRAVEDAGHRDDALMSGVQFGKLSHYTAALSFDGGCKETPRQELV